MNSQYADQLQRAERNRSTSPYLLLQRGPSATPCPIHGKNENVVLPVDNPYWRLYPMREHPECKCWVRSISHWALKRLRENGVQDPDAPRILNENGLPTGHREKRLIPIKTKLVE